VTYILSCIDILQGDLKTVQFLVIYMQEKNYCCGFVNPVVTIALHCGN
jgi:hypothetical protein